MKTLLSYWILFWILVGSLGHFASALSILSNGHDPELMSLASKVESSTLEVLPTQDRGRIKPFHTLARETNLFLTGKYGWEGLDPVSFYLALVLHPTVEKLDIINVRDVQLRRQLGFQKEKRYFSAAELEKSDLENMVEPLLKKEQKNSRSLEPHEKSVIEAYNQLWLLKEIHSGRHWFNALNLEQLRAESRHEGSEIVKAARSFLQGQLSARELVHLVRAQKIPPMMTTQMDHLSLEVFYNKSRIFMISALFFLGLGLALFFKKSSDFFSTQRTMWISLVPILLLALGFYMRIQITGFAPVTNMYGTMIWVSLGVSLFNLVLLALYGNRQITGVLWLLSAGLLLITENMPLVLSPDLDPIVAVLRSNLWLTIHVLTIVISYSALSIAMILANTILIKTVIHGEVPQDLSQALTQAIYRMTQLGVFLLSVGIILGGVWADYSWGRFWGWDPKETWALIADIGFIALLHARHIGWLPPFRMAVATPLAYLLVIMAWYGVNFILTAGLHSYGFSKGGATAVITFVSLQTLLIGAAIFRRSGLKADCP